MRARRHGGILAGLTLGLMLSALPAAAQTAGDLVGVWRGQMVTLMGPMAVELILMPDGRYSNAAMAQGMMTRHWGQWRLISGVLRLDLHGAEPREWCGPRGCTPLHWPAGETWPVDMPDRRTLRTTNGVLMRVD